MIARILAVLSAVNKLPSLTDTSEPSSIGKVELQILDLRTTHTLKLVFSQQVRVLTWLHQLISGSKGPEYDLLGFNLQEKYYADLL